MKLTLRYENEKQTKQIKNNISKSYIGLFKNLMSSALIKDHILNMRIGNYKT